MQKSVKTDLYYTDKKIDTDTRAKRGSGLILEEKKISPVSIRNYVSYHLPFLNSIFYNTLLSRGDA